MTNSAQRKGKIDEESGKRCKRNIGKEQNNNIQKERRKMKENEKERKGRSKLKKWNDKKSTYKKEVDEEKEQANGEILKTDEIFKNSH